MQLRLISDDQITHYGLLVPEQLTGVAGIQSRYEQWHRDTVQYTTSCSTQLQGLLSIHTFALLQQLVKGEFQLCARRVSHAQCSSSVQHRTLVI